jgi:hypothetical protein
LYASNGERIGDVLRWWVGGRIADAVFMQSPKFSAAACECEKWMLREALAGQEFYRLRAVRPGYLGIKGRGSRHRTDYRQQIIL